MKWLPEPSVPSWVAARFGFSRVLGGGCAASHTAAASDTCFLSLPTPAGMLLWQAFTQDSAWSVTKDADALTLLAAIPHPISTPTADGITPDSAGITEPIVAPIPRCASAISAIGSVRMGNRAVFSACSLVLSSRIDAQDLTPTPPSNSSIIG